MPETSCMTKYGELSKFNLKSKNQSKELQKQAGKYFSVKNVKSHFVLMVFNVFPCSSTSRSVESYRLIFNFYMC